MDYMNTVKARRFLPPARTILSFLLTFVLVTSATVTALAGPVGNAAGFEDDDGNLAPETPINFDWNSFAPTTWTGTAPNRTSSKTIFGWAFTGLEDAQATTSDSAFAGGTKQDNDCASVIGAKAPNKDDLKRVYVASNTVGGDVFLTLAWVRIPQNTTSPSAHIGFEFNQSSTACPPGSNGLVRRTAGDMLIVYDFEGGATDTPTITLRRWVTSGACEVGSNSPPCWGPSTNLTALGFAEAKVNTFGSVTDQIGPTPPETLETNEFGEAGINLTDAGVFSSNVCTAFGKTYAVSRSSGNSATAQMKDLVGPGNINITNCGRVIIRKATVPSPDPTDTTFSYTATGGLDPATFGLKNGESLDYGGDVFAGSYSVTEADPAPLFTLTSLDCSASSTSHGTTITVDLATRTTSFDLKPLDTVDCTFTNTLQTGAILVTKTRKHAATPSNNAHPGVTFTVNGETDTTDANGQVCFDGLPFGTYDVVETVPSGYVGEGGSTTTVTKSVTVDNAASCSDDPFGGETVSFSNMPLTDIAVSVDSQVDGGTASTIFCVDADDNSVASGSTGANGDGSATANNLLPGEYICTIVIDP
jgi:hypothetical protein